MAIIDQLTDISINHTSLNSGALVRSSDGSSFIFKLLCQIKLYYSTELMRRMKRYQIANYKCLIVKYAKDVRYDKDGIATHDK